MNPITNLHQNQNKVIVLAGYDDTTANITLASGHGAMLPDISIPYNLIWWNASDYLNPTDDPSAEIVKCIAKFGDTLIIMRSQQQTLASPKNIPGKLYNMVYLPDNNDNNLVTLSYYNEPQLHGKTKHDATTIDGGIALPIGQLPTHGIGAHTGTIGTWANIDKTTSSITDITTRSHTLLTDIGTNTHVAIDEAISNISKGTSWTTRSAAADNMWQSITYGNGLFVAIGRTGVGNRVMTSPDGINWTARTPSVDNNWRGITYGNGLFVAVSYSGVGNRVMTSPDGITWTTRTPSVDNDWNDVTYGNGLFVAIASTGAGNRIMTSPDGINWTTRTSAADRPWSSVTYGNGVFVAVSTWSGAGAKLMTSTDGITWVLRDSTADSYWNDVTYGNGLFVAVAYTGTTSCVMTSLDGTTWTPRTGASNNSWRSVTYGNGLFVAVADYPGAGNRVMTSPDGITWTTRTSAADNEWYSVTYGNGMFVAVSATGSGNRVMTSGKSELNIIPTNNIYQGGMRIMSGSVGIGTTIPTSLLDVHGTTQLRGYVGGTGLTVDASGNVGIGTTGPTAKLHIGGTPGTDGIKFPDGTLQTTATIGMGINFLQFMDTNMVTDYTLGTGSIVRNMPAGTYSGITGATGQFRSLQDYKETLSTKPRVLTFRYTSASSGTINLDIPSPVIGLGSDDNNYVGLQLMSTGWILACKNGAGATSMTYSSISIGTNQLITIYATNTKVVCYANGIYKATITTHIPTVALGIWIRASYGPDCSIALNYLISYPM